jgi:hypothetical protein
VVAFNGQLWVMGGATGNTTYNDVWASSDGRNWIQLTNAAPWYTQFSFGALVHNKRTRIGRAWSSDSNPACGASFGWNPTFLVHSSYLLLQRFCAFEFVQKGLPGARKAILSVLDNHPRFFLESSFLL